MERHHKESMLMNNMTYMYRVKPKEGRLLGKGGNDTIEGFSEYFLLSTYYQIE